MRVCYFGTYRADYARNQIMIEGLRQAGIEVVECHQPLWQGVEDRVQIASGGWMRPRFWWRVIRTYSKLLRKFRRVGAFDLMIVGYPGHYDVFLARWLSWMRGKPLVWDVLNSLYLITLERGLHQRSPLTARIVRGLEKLACRLPNLLILDTEQFVAWFVETHGADADRFKLVPIGADERVFQPVDNPAGSGEIFKIIYYGSFIPNHGVETIVEAANILADEAGIHFEMIGDGPEKPKAVALAQQKGLQNITFVDWLEHEALIQHIAEANLVLGVFGTTRQLSLTNNNKIYEGFAMRKPVISARTPAMPGVLEHGVHLYLCERGDAASLAQGILELKSDPALRNKLAELGNRIFNEHFTVTRIGQVFAAHLENFYARTASPHPRP